MYDRKVQEIKDKQEDILEQQRLHSKADKSFYIVASRILELANKAAQLFESSEREQKRQLLQFVLQNCQLRGKNIDFTLKKPFDAILLANKSQDWLLSPKTIRTLVFRIIKVFEDISQVELSKGRWEEIKKLQLQPTLSV